MNYSSTLLRVLTLLYTTNTFDAPRRWDYHSYLLLLLLLDTIYMATHTTKGWQSFPKPIGRLEPLSTQRFTTTTTGSGGYERESKTGDHDECIYYPLVYGHEEKLKIVVNPTHTRLFANNKKSSSAKTKTTTQQTPLVLKGSKKDGSGKERKPSYGTGDDEGDYAMLCSTTTTTVAQLSPPTLQQEDLGSRFSSRRRDCGSGLHAPVSRSVLRALSNDFEQNAGRVMTFEPRNTAAAAIDGRHHHHTQQPLSYRRATNNNYVYEVGSKKVTTEGRFLIAPHSFSDELIERGDNEELLDYCTCMCCVKGAFYHLTKDGDNEGHVADEPCSCAGPLSHCLPRWACLGIFSLFLPCLCCYLPVKGCKNVGNKPSTNNKSSPLGVQSPK